MNYRQCIIDGVCPHCGSVGAAEGGPVEIDGGQAFQMMSCACGASWTEVYLADDIVELDTSRCENDVPQLLKNMVATLDGLVNEGVVTRHVADNVIDLVSGAFVGSEGGELADIERRLSAVESAIGGLSFDMARRDMDFPSNGVC